MARSAAASELSVVVPSRLRPEALERLLRCLAAQSHPRFEVLVALDGGGAVPAVPAGMAVRYLDLPHVGISDAKNHALSRAQSDLVVLLNDDVEPRPDFLAEHLRAQRRGAGMVLGASPFLPAERPCRLDWLVARTRMIFFYQGLQAGQYLDFRHAWNLNLSLDRARFGASQVRFASGLRPCMYEDLELAHRLLGEEPAILYHPAACAPHRHRYTLAGYFVRESLLGVMAPTLWHQSPACFRAVFGEDLGGAVQRARSALDVDRRDQQRALAWLAGLAAQPCAQPPPHSVEAGPWAGVAGDPWLNTWYVAHLPLKRRAFRVGLLAALASAQAWPRRPDVARLALGADRVLSGLFELPEGGAVVRLPPVASASSPQV